MTILIIIAIFVLGYLAIAFEHPLKLNKAASALITGVLCWTVYMLTSEKPDDVLEEIIGHLGEIASILFFLLGAMTIVELIDSHDGFDIITQKIKTKSKSILLIIITSLTFILSAFLDNLTTAIVMTSLCAKILEQKEDKLWFAGMIVIAANAGGAWSPLGDVTTTMLWIGGQISAFNIVKQLILPSIIVCIVPMALAVGRFKGKQIRGIPASQCTPREKRNGKIILFSGIGFLLFVPLFKTLTHLPPFMGMLLVLGFMWIITTILHSKANPDEVERFTVTRALQKVDTPSVLFFLGILLAVSALQSTGILRSVAVFLQSTLKNDYSIAVALGLVSSLVDNVPLVAASQAMYDLNTYPMDHPFWLMLALTTGTGGSAIIIGSAAGVAVMGIEKIQFSWYLRKISWLALIGFASGVLVFLLQR